MKVLIPIDDSATALRAIDWLAQQPGAASIEVSLLNVRSQPEQYGAVSVLDYDAVERALREAQQQLLGRALGYAQRAGLQRVSIHAGHGLAAEEVVAGAKTMGVDQIVMATHGRGAVGNFFLGSVAQRVVHLAPMAVTLVK
jgi:nucleotide-binding universal stress UspA family protein